MVGVLDRYLRRGAVHHALLRPGDADTGARVARRHLLRGGLGQRQRHGLLRPGGRGHAPLSTLAPPGRDRSGHRCRGLRRARRSLLPGRGPNQRRPVRADGPRFEGDLRGPGAAGRRPAGHVLGHRATTTGDRVQRRPRRRRPAAGRTEPVPHRDQRRSRGLPADGGPRRLARPIELERGDRGTSRGPARQRGPVRRAPGGLRAGGGRDPHQGDRRGGRDIHAGRSARVPVHGVGRGQPRVRVEDPALRVHVADHTAVRLRPGPGVRRCRAPQTTAGARGLRSRPLPDRAAVGGGRGRDRGPDLDGLPARPGPPARVGGRTGGAGRRPRAGGRRGRRGRGRRRAVPPVRIRVLRGLDGSHVLVAAPQPARPWIRLRHRPCPRRGRDGTRLVRRGEARGQAEHVHRFRGLCPDAGRPPDGRRPTGWWPGEGVREVC